MKANINGSMGLRASVEQSCMLHYLLSANHIPWTLDEASTFDSASLAAHSLEGRA